MGSDSDSRLRLAPKSQRVSKSSKNIFLQDANAITINQQKSARNVSADRIQMMGNAAERQLLINKNQMISIEGSQPQLLMQDTLQQDVQRARNQSMKKRIPLKKGGPGGGTARVNTSSFQEASQSAPGSRK